MPIFDTESEEPGALDVYVDSNGWIWFDVQDTILHDANVLIAPMAMAQPNKPSMRG
jgi:hypothetical protein